MKEVIECWDKKAKAWRKYVGDTGDNNRRFNSDPVLWAFAGDVAGKDILDCGCGTGYLSILMAKKGARVLGIDISPKMIEEAHKGLASESLHITFRVDSASELKTVEDRSVDIAILNYVLMDVPELDAAVKNIYRVLRPDGRAVVIIGHPANGCLPEDRNYFDESKVVERWGPFDSDFIYFHRPISQYWRSFKRVGFQIEDFDEPIAQDPNVPGFKEEWKKSYRKTPWSMAFLLRKS
jgi:ubiquinone/menaquinone biosynthesis C-methylase UbiE